MKKLVMLLLLAGFPALGLAVPIDPDPDGVGIYFDLEATHYNIVHPTYTFGTAWVILTNASTMQDVTGWEFRLEHTPNLYNVTTDMPAETFNFDAPPDYQCQNQNGLPWSPTIWLLSVSFVLFAYEPATLTLDLRSSQWVPGQLTYLTGSIYAPIPHRMNYNMGTLGNPGAFINWPGYLPIETSQETWGGVKALYR